MVYVSRVLEHLSLYQHYTHAYLQNKLLLYQGYLRFVYRKGTVLLLLQVYELFKLVRHGFTTVVEVQSVVIKEIHAPVRIRLWKQTPNYLAVINDERDVRFLEPYVGRSVTLKIAGIYVSGTLIRVKHGRRYELEVVLPKRLSVTWEKLRDEGIEHDAIVIVELKEDEEVV